MKADTHRQFGSSSWSKWLWGIVRYRCFRAVITHRLAQKSPIFAPLHLFACWLAGMDLDRHARIGPGLHINHGYGLVVSHGARVGANVTFFRGAPPGRRAKIDEAGNRLTEYPVVEDEVCIGPHAVIIGGVTIGRGSRIAAGAFVTSSIPPYSVVQGNPAQIVKSGCVPDVNNKAPLA